MRSLRSHTVREQAEIFKKQYLLPSNRLNPRIEWDMEKLKLNAEHTLERTINHELLKIAKSYLDLKAAG